MARQQYSCWDALDSIIKATSKSQNGDLSQNQKLEATNKALSILNNSNFKTLAGNMDRAIELQHRIEEQAALEAGQAGQIHVANVEAERVGLPAMPIPELPELEEDEDF